MYSDNLFTIPDTQDELDIFSIPDTPVAGFYMHVFTCSPKISSLGPYYSFQNALRVTGIESIFYP